jgi:hypothetical protein
LTGTARALVLVAGVIVLVEAAAYLVLAALDLRDAGAGSLGSALGVALLLVVYGGAQLVAIWFLLGGSAAARSPLVVTQLLQVLVAFSLRDTGAVAIAIAVPAAVVLGCVLSPPVRQGTQPGV